MYVVDATGQGVFVYAALKPEQTSPEYLGFFGGEGSANGAFLFPNGINLDDRGRHLRCRLWQRPGAGVELLRPAKEVRPEGASAADWAAQVNSPQ